MLVELRIKVRVANEVSDTLLRIGEIHPELIGEHADVDDVVDAAYGSENSVSHVLEEALAGADKEQVTLQRVLAILQYFLVVFEVEADVEALHGFSVMGSAYATTSPRCLLVITIDFW